MPTSFAEVALGGYTIRPDTALVIQAENAHDVATFTVGLQYFPSETREWDPVRIEWGAAGDSQIFYGYVHHIEPVYTAANRDWIKCVCMGASSIFRQAVSREWRYQTADLMVAEMAGSFHFSVDTEPASYVWPLITANESAWKFLLDMADKVGYTVAVNRTEVRFQSAAALIRRASVGAPALVYGNNLTHFRPLVGQASDGAGTAVRVMEGIDAETDRQFVVTDDGGKVPVMGREYVTPILTVPERTLTATSVLEAQETLAAASRKARFIYQAQAEVRGIPSLTQAAVVYLQGVGSDLEGHWYVHQVEHEMGAEYGMYLQLGRDSRGSFPHVPTLPLLMRADPHGDVTSAQPPTVLVNGAWRSGWARRPVQRMAVYAPVVEAPPVDPDGWGEGGWGEGGWGE